MKRLCILLALIFILLCAPAVCASENPDADQPTPVYTVEEFLSMEAGGSYILMEDLDLAGVEWPCPDFSGTLDGNGHAILNLSLTQTGATTATSYDGNLKTYDTRFAGLFATVKDATIQNLHLLGVQALVVEDCPVFVGALAGFSENSQFTGCSVSGTLELRAHDRMFGIAGLVGYGSGAVSDCKVDVTLICTDTDQTKRDEQFMGGIYSTGFMDVTDCTVNIDGYSSEYGYAHNGGVVGMYMQRPLGNGKTGKLTGNTVTGKITFFEKNSDRRAYCRAVAGEVLASSYSLSNNTTDFERDERYTYDIELRPEMCEAPSYDSQVIAPGCSSYGYSEHTCTGCGYAFRDAYTPFAHTLTQWTVVTPATTQTEGESESACDLCGLTFTRTDPVLPEPPTEAPTAPQKAPTQQPSTQPEESNNDFLLPLLIIVGLIVAGSLLIVFIYWWTHRYHGRFSGK